MKLHANEEKDITRTENAILLAKQTGMKNPYIFSLDLNDKGAKETILCPLSKIIPMWD